MQIQINPTFRYILFTIGKSNYHTQVKSNYPTEKVFTKSKANPLPYIFQILGQNCPSTPRRSRPDQYIFLLVLWGSCEQFWIPVQQSSKPCNQRNHTTAKDNRASQKSSIQSNCTRVTHFPLLNILSYFGYSWQGTWIILKVYFVNSFNTYQLNKFHFFYLKHAATSVTLNTTLNLIR